METPVSNEVESKESCLGDGTRKLVLLAGLPGTGKGTTQEYLMLAYDAVTLGMGDLLRKYLREDILPALTPRIREGMAKRLVDPDVVRAVLLDAFHAIPKSVRLVVLDGIPRTEGDAKLAAADLAPLFHQTYFVVLDAPDDVLVERCIARGRDDSCTKEQVQRRIRVEREAFKGVVDCGVLKQWRVDVDANCSAQTMFGRVERALGLTP